MQYNPKKIVFFAERELLVVDKPHLAVDNSVYEYSHKLVMYA